MGSIFDALIITGAPVEALPRGGAVLARAGANYELVPQPLFWAAEICWGAQVLMKHFTALEKYQLADKLFGVYNHALPLENSRLMQGLQTFSDACFALYLQ